MLLLKDTTMSHILSYCPTALNPHFDLSIRILYLLKWAWNTWCDAVNKLVYPKQAMYNRAHYILAFITDVPHFLNVSPQFYSSFNIIWQVCTSYLNSRINKLTSAWHLLHASIECPLDPPDFLGKQSVATVSYHTYLCSIYQESKKVNLLLTKQWWGSNR